MSSLWNLTDLGYVVINCAQIFFRFLYINSSIIVDWRDFIKEKVEGEEEKVFETLDRILLLVNFATLIISSFKIIVLLRMFESIASLV